MKANKREYRLGGDDEIVTRDSTFESKPLEMSKVLGRLLFMLKLGDGSVAPYGSQYHDCKTAVIAMGFGVSNDAIFAQVDVLAEIVRPFKWHTLRATIHEHMHMKSLMLEFYRARRVSKTEEEAA